MIVMASFIIPLAMQVITLTLPCHSFQFPFHALSFEIMFHTLQVLFPLLAFTVLLVLHSFEFKFKVPSFEIEVQFPYLFVSMKTLIAFMLIFEIVSLQVLPNLFGFLLLDLAQLDGRLQTTPDFFPKFLLPINFSVIMA